MSAIKHAKAFAPLALLCGLALMVTGCLLSPGAFVSRLDIRKDHSFTYSYQGEIYMLPLSKMAQSPGSQDSGEFQPQPCHDEQYEERTCTASEIAQQREDWEASSGGQVKMGPGADQESAMLKAMLGGLDASDPEAAQELARRLSRQKGWRSVEYVGDGLFNVDFEISGTLGHDFMFPTIEQFPMANFFVTTSLRDNGSIRIDAPGFSPEAGAGPMAGMMNASAAAKASESGSGEAPRIPELQGRFTIVTDGEVLSNNTDEGAQINGNERTMVWAINSRTPAAPMALIQLD